MGKVIFVNGTARCGSTMVDLILGNDPQGFSMGEVCSWFRPTRTHHFDIKCGCGVYPCAVWDELRGAREDEIYDRVFQANPVSFAVDSSKRLTWVIDQNLRLRADGRHEIVNIFLYKDPVSLHYSLWKRGVHDLSRTSGAYQYYRRAIDAGIPFVSVNYDWLIEDMSSRLPSICDVVGVDYQPEKERFWEGRHHHLFGSFGPRRQLRAANPSIYREEFHPEYSAIVERLEASFRSDAKLQSVLRELRRRDVREDSRRPVAQSSGVRRPLFYYRQRLQELRSRFFPEHYLDREASAIHEWNV